MKRPIGVTITAVWLAVLLALLLVLAIRSGNMRSVVTVVVVAGGLASVIAGLWQGRGWAVRAFRVLLFMAVAVSLVSVFVSRKSHNPLYYMARTAAMGTWLWYFFRPRVGAYFGEVMENERACPQESKSDT